MSHVKETGFWALALLGLAFFFRPLFLDESFFFRDIYLYYVPIKQILVAAIAAGEAPFWNPYLHGGQPLLGDVSSTALYPSTLLYLLLPAARALSVDVALHGLAAAAALYLLARRLGRGQPSSARAGVVYGYCGTTLSQANLYFRLLAMPYLPLMLLAWHLFLHRRQRRFAAALLALGLLQLFAGSPEMVALTWITLLGWTLAFSPPGFSLGRRLAGWLLCGAAVALLAAPQLLPLVEMAGQSQRGAGMDVETFGFWSLDARRLPELVLPGFTGRIDTLVPDDYWGGGIVDSGFPYVLSLYLGALALALALLGGTHRGGGALPRRARRFLLGLLLLAVVLSLGRHLPFFELAYRWVPGIQVFRYPIKLMTLGLLPAALLAAEGAEAVAGAGDRRRRTIARVAWGGAGVSALLGLVWTVAPAFAQGVQRVFFGQADARIAEGLAQAWLWAGAVWLAATLALRLHGLRRGAWLPWVLAALVALDLTASGRRVNPTVPTALIAEEPPAAALVREHLRGGRFYRAPITRAIPLRSPTADIQWLYRWSQEVLRFYLAASYGIEVIYHLDYDGLAPARVMRLQRTLEAVPWDRRLALLSAGAVRVLVTDEVLAEPGIEKLATIGSSSQPFHVYRNARAADREQLVRAYRRVASADEAVAAMLAPGFDPRQHAVVEGEVPDADLACRGPGRAAVTESSLHRRRIAVTTACPGLLVLSEVHYPGWRATVDGRPAPLLRANTAFTAVWLAAGEHEVEWRYVPRAFYLGLAISGATLGVLLGLAARGRRRSRAALGAPMRP